MMGVENQNIDRGISPATIPAVPFKEDHELEADPDISVRVWHDHMYGASPRYIMSRELIGRARLTSIMSAPVPAVIAADMRHITGLRGIWINQAHQPLLNADGDPFAFHVLLIPYRLTDRALRSGLREIRDLIRNEGSRKFRFGYLMESTPLYALLRMIHARGYPGWEIDANGSGKRYDGRFGHLIDAAIKDKGERA